MELLKTLEAENRVASVEEKRVLAQFSGWGHSPQVFDEIKALDYQAHLKGHYTYGNSPEVLEKWSSRYGEFYQRLREILSPDEWSSAQASILNSHYTSREVVEHGLWATARHLGFAGGRVLETSAGIGHVLGLVPADVAADCQFTACELDPTAGRMLRKLYPQANVHVLGFQDAKISAHSQDLVIGNFPFNKEGWSSEKYPFSLHNQFFARSLDLTAPGGLIIAITSDSTMDSPASASFRHWMNQRADFIGAIRLPNNTFAKNAGTQVTTDILIFRKHDGQPFEFRQAFSTTRSISTGKALEDGTPEAVDINEYFHRHPDMMLGRMTREGKMYHGDSPALIAHQDRELLPQLQAAVRKLPSGIARQSSPLEETATSAPLGQAHVDHKEGSYQIASGKVVQVSGGQFALPDFGDNPILNRQAARWITLRDAAKRLFACELSWRASSEDVEAARSSLRQSYDSYVQAYGRVNKSSRDFLGDPESSIPAALENEVTQKYYSRDKGGRFVQRLRQVYLPAEILSHRVLYPSMPPHRADSISDAVTISRSWKGQLDLGYMGVLLRRETDAVKQDLIAQGLGFEDPATGQIISTDEYRSGNVKEKLRIAKEACTDHLQYQTNVAALQEVQPQPLKIHQIKFSLGATWLPTFVVDAWLNQLFDRRDAGVVTRVPETGRFLVRWDHSIRDDARNTDTYAGGGVSARHLIEDALNLKASIAYDEVYDAEKNKTIYVKNPQRTAAAQDAQQKLKELFYEWARKCDLVPEIEAEYNRVRNAYRQRQWQAADFKHFPNSSTAVELRPHQKTSVARNMVECNLMAHPVGSGKTYVYATTAMEWKRLGLANKPLIAVLKSTLGQVEEAFRRLYPQAKILVPREKDFAKENRQRLLARIATGDYDAVIITHDHLNGIPDDPQRERDYIHQSLSGLVEAIHKTTQAEGRETPTVKQLRHAKDRLEKRLHELHDRKTDNNLNFEQLGIDALIVDEAHMYKKLEFQTQMDHIKGLDKGASQRSSSLFMKARYIQDRNGGRNVILGTGTPITNTLAEIWNMMRYVRPDLLADYHVSQFDEFATAFTEPITQLEQTDTGQFRHVTRLARFTNLPELQTLFRSAADVVDGDALDIPKPALEGGGPKTLTLPQTPQVREFMQYLIARYERWNAMSGKEKRDNSAEPLVINGLARKAALDMRLIDPQLPDDPDSKLNRVVRETFARWEAGRALSSTQVLFADSYQSPGYEVVPGQVDDEGKPARKAIPDEKRFNVFREIKRKLMELGVPQGQIEDIHDHDSDRRKVLLFERVNKGQVRVIMGSTEKLGTGVNIQAKLKALHHIDAPWRPSDMEQREGRMLRQGNENATVEILRYGVDRSFDANAYQRLDTKERFIRSILSGSNTLREAEDSGSEIITSFADAFAAISGNPLVRQRFDVETRIRHLERLQYQFDEDQSRSREHLRRARSDADTAERHAVEIRRQASVLIPVFADSTRLSVITAEGSMLGERDCVEILERFVRKHLDDLRQRFARQLSFDRASRNVQDRRESLRLPDIIVNGLTVYVDAQIAYRAETIDTPERITDPEIRYSFQLPGTDLWKSGFVTTGKGLAESIARKIAELEEDAKLKDRLAETKRRQIIELSGLQDRTFTHAQELSEQRTKLEEIKRSLELSTTTATTDETPDAAHDTRYEQP